MIAGGTVPEPDHVRIDVDGIEPQVIHGACTTIRTGRVRSLLLEVNQNLPDHMAMIEELMGYGFRYDPAQVTRATPVRAIQGVRGIRL